MKLRRLALSLSLLWTCTAHAVQPRWPTPNEFRAGAEQFTYNRLQDAQRLFLGPQPPHVAPVPASQTCAELYAQRLRLMQTQYNYTPPYSDDPRNRAAVFVGALFNPALYYLTFTGLQHYLGPDQTQTTAELDALRYASAAQQCYVR